VSPTTPSTSSSLSVLYECGGCGERLLNERRCEGCNHWARRLGPAIVCPHCDEPILLADVLQGGCRPPLTGPQPR